MSKESEDLTAIIEMETNKRINQYYDFKPGSPDCSVKPFTPKDALLAVYLSAAMVALFAWGAMSVFPSYFPR